VERLYLAYSGPGADRRSAVRASHEGELTIARVGFDPQGATDAGVEGWRDLEEHPLSHVYPQPRVNTDRRSLHDLLRDLRASGALRSADERTREAAALMQAIAERLRRDPAGTAAILDRIRREGAKQAEEAGVLIGALGTAGTPAAQKALGMLITDAALPTSLHVQALTQLAFVHSPTAESLATVEDATHSANDEEQSTSTLVLGAMARSLHDEAPQAAASKVQQLIDRYLKATDLDEKLLLLSALGNAGSLEALPLILEALRSEVTTLRIEAVRALRFMPPGIGDATIDRTLATDADVGVRKAAVFALGFRDLNAHASIVGTVLSRDVSPAVRLAMVNLLGSAIGRYLPALAILKSAAVADPDEDVRNAAASFVKSASSSPDKRVAGPTTSVP
jgi:hypothetical protein